MDTDDRTTSLRDLDARVLRAGAPRGRSASLIAEHAGWLPDITLSTPAPPASHGLVGHDGNRPPDRWRGTCHGDAAPSSSDDQPR